MVVRSWLLLTTLLSIGGCATLTTLADVEALRAAAAAPADSDVVVEASCEFDARVSDSSSTSVCRQVVRHAEPPQQIVLPWSTRDGDALAIAVVTASGRAIQFDDATLLRHVHDGTLTLDLASLVGAHDPVRLSEHVRRRVGWFHHDEGLGRMLALSVPTRRVTTTVTIDDNQGAVLRIHHAAPSVSRTSRGGRVTFTFVLDDVAALPEGIYGPDLRAVSPWWSLHLAHAPRWQVPLAQWSTLKTEAERLTKRPVEIAACADRRCRLDAAVRSVLDQIEFVARDEVPPSLGAARNRNVASGAQMTALVWRALVDIGEAPEIAWSSAFPALPLDDEIPSSRDINRWLVVVAGDTADAPPIWIDPRCRGCAVGELPFAIRDRPAIVVVSRDGRLTTRRATVVGAQTMSPRSERKVRVDVAADGAALVTVDVEDFGIITTDDTFALRTVEHARRQRELVLVEYASWLGQTARSTLTLVDNIVHCDRRGHCTNRYSFTVKGSADFDDGNTMKVPAWGARVPLDFYLRDRDREMPVCLDNDAESEVVTVVPPPGWHVVDAGAHGVFQSTSPLCSVDGSAAVRDGSLVLERRWQCRAGEHPAAAATELNATFLPSWRFARTPVTFERDASSSPPTPPTTLPEPPPPLSDQASR